MSLSSNQAYQVLWQAGELADVVRLHDIQRQIRAQYYTSNEHVFVLCCARRLGKSYLLTSLALEACRRGRNNQVLFIAGTQKQVRSILLPMVREQLASCPSHLRPQYKATDNKFEFPETGMSLTILGADNGRLENARGNKASLVIVDEAAFVDNLGYAVTSILSPMCKGAYGEWSGRVLLASTPPVSPSHDFYKFCQRADARDVLCHYTIYDNPLFTDEQIEEAKEECGGENTTDYKREYLAQFVTDETRAVVPEFTKEAQKELVQGFELPPYFHSCLAADLGFHDLTFIVLLAYDFLEAKVKVLDERVLRKPTSDEVARAVEAIERPFELPYHTRVIDAPAFTTNDFYAQHKVVFRTPKKDDKHAALANLRHLIYQRRLLIDPRCKHLCQHLEYAVWNKSKSSYERSEEFGHYDGVDAMSYGLRHLNMTTNPYPRLPENVSMNTHYIPPGMDAHRDIGTLFHRKKGRRL